MSFSSCFNGFTCRSSGGRASLPARSALVARALVTTALVGIVVGAGATWASPRANQAVRVEVRVIEARTGSHVLIDPRLKALARDLKSLPFQEFDLVDQHLKTLKPGERLSFQFPGPGKEKERFLVVTSQGTAEGKLAFHLAIDALKFKTRVAVPDGGTIVVGGPRSTTGNLMFAVTARLEK